MSHFSTKVFARRQPFTMVPPFGCETWPSDVFRPRLAAAASSCVRDQIAVAGAAAAEVSFL
jgi:hypothetical protein